MPDRSPEAGAHLQFALDAAGIGIWDWDIPTGQRNWDIRSKRLFGYAAEDPIDFPALRRRMPPEDQVRAERAIAAALDPAGDGSYDQDYHVLLPDGTERWVRSVGRVTFEGRDDARRAVRFTGVLIDITARKQFEQMLAERRQDLRLLTDLLPIPLGRSDREHRALFVNKAYAARFGLRPQDIVGRHIRDVTGHTAYEQVAPYIRTAEMTGNVVDVELPITYERFGTRHIRYVLAPEVDAAGHVRSVVTAIQDVTESVLATARLADSEARFRQMADSAPVMVYVTDAAGACTFASRSWLAFTGQTEADALGFNWADALHPDDRARVLDAFLAANAERRPFNADYRVRRADGAWRWVLSAAVRREDARGAFLGFIGSLLDITERKEAEQALEEADRRKDEFLAMLAHELRNPLAPIRTGAELLQRLPAGDPRIRRHAEMITRQVTHLARLVDDLLDVSRVTRGKITLHRRPVPLGDVLGQALDLARPLIASRGHALDIGGLGAGITVNADPTRLAQVFGNLLNNAAKYTPDGGLISLAVHADDQAVEITVSDNGTGIEPDLLPLVFDMFTQGNRAIDRTQGGLGIGLALVKALVDLHDGSVLAASAGEGRGAQFAVRLPVIKPA